jgi:hypothetical protein
MNRKVSCGTDALLIKPCPAVVPAIQTGFKYISNRDDLYVDLSYFTLQNVSYRGKH